LRRGAYYGRYASGHLLYVSRGTLFAAPFDLDRLEVVGEPAAMVEGVMANPAITGGAQYSVADTGTLAYVTGQSAALQRPVHWLTRGGAATLLRTTPSNWSDPRFSPSGQQLATVIPNEAGMVALWIYDWTRDVLTRVSATNAVAPVWSADGQFIAYASPIPAEKRTAIFVERVDATTPAERLTRNPTPQFPHSWHPNGKLLAVTELSEAAGLDVMLLPVERSDGSGWKAAAATPFISSPANEQEPMFSPDGKWVAYTSNETGRDEIYVRSLTSAARSAVSTGGGRHPAWSRTRAEILYNSPDGSIMSTAYTVEHDTLRLQKPQVWSTLRTFQRSPSQGGFYSWSFDVHPDGERLAAALAPQARGDGNVVLVFNLLRQRR
jgi:serine/threonine-protein kinase